MPTSRPPSTSSQGPIPDTSSHCNLYCEGCGGCDFYRDDDDGHYYCSQCGSQSQDLIHTATADEDLLADGALYNISYARSYSQSQNPSPLSKAQLSQQLSQKLEQARALHAHANDSDPVKFAGFDDDELSEPRDFGSGSCSDKEAVADGLRLRYVEGLQVMVQGQCEALVERFGVSPYVVGIVGPIWLRYVAAMQVLADDWPDKVIQESDVAADAAGLVRLGERERSNKVKCIKPKYRSEPYNSHGQRAKFIWLHYLRRTVPLYSTLAISFLVCHIAREPILPTDISRWTSEEKLPYLTAFTDMDRRLGTPCTCPLSSKALFRPYNVIGADQLEVTAASIAQTIGLHLPFVNFYAIAHRYLKEMYLPVEKILPHACCIYEWSLPTDLWLSSNSSGCPTRACVMSILIVAMRLLYNIQGQGTWEMSKMDIRNVTSNDQTSHPTADTANLRSMSKDEYTDYNAKRQCNAPGSKPDKKLLRIQASDYNCQELLSILEATYEKINTAHDYSKDMSSYLKYCKDVLYAGITKSYEEEKLIERLWDMYEKQEDDNAGEAKRPRTGVSNDNSLDPMKRKEDDKGRAMPMEEDFAGGNLLKEPLTLPNSRTVIINVAIEKIKLEMEANGFEYLTPQVHRKIGYVHYRRQRVDGKLVCVAPADYYLVLRACAKLAEVDAQTMHQCVLSFERRLEWIDKQIDKLFCHEDGES